MPLITKYIQIIEAEDRLRAVKQVGQAACIISLETSFLDFSRQRKGEELELEKVLGVQEGVEVGKVGKGKTRTQL